MRSENFLRYKKQKIQEIGLEAWREHEKLKMRAWRKKLRHQEHFITCSLPVGAGNQPLSLL